MPLLRGEKRHFIGGPAAFGADGEDGVRAFVCGEDGGERRFFFSFGKQNFSRCNGGGERGFQGERVVDGRNIRAARLLRGFDGDAAPAFDTLSGRLREMLFSAAREHGRDAGNAKLGRFLDCPLETVELEDGEEEMEGQGRFGRHFLMQ